MTQHPVVMRLPVQWGEMDALGHVNNTRFFSWFESARIELARQSGLYGDATPLVPVLVATACEFLKPVHFPGTVCVGVRVGSVGNSSVGMEYAVWMDGAPDVLHAKGTSTIVMLERESRRKAAIPDDIRQALRRFQ